MNRKGLMKGVIQAGIVFALVFALFFTAYMLLASATVSLSTNNTVQANATFDTNQTNIEFNLTINITDMIRSGTPIRTIYINFSEAGFVNIAAANLRCPENATGAHSGQIAWNATSPNTGVLACNASTYGGTSSANNTLTGVVDVRIFGLTARSSAGTPTFNVTVEHNLSGFLSNSTLVQITILELQASAGVNDTTSGIHEQRSYNFTITNNATDPDYFDTIDQIRIDYTGSGFTDTGDGNVTCPKIPATTGVAWDKTNSSLANTITCSKPAGTGSALGKGSSTNIVVNNWGASPRAGTLRFRIIVNGTNANGTYTTANESSPSVVVNGTINITATSMTPVNVAVNRTNITVVRYAFTTVGEDFNVSVIKVTRAGTAADVDFKTVRLVNDTDKDNALDSTDTPVFNASTTTTNGQYLFTGIDYRVTNNDTLFLVVDLNTSATAGRTFNFNINATSDVNSLGASSGANVSEANASTLQSTQATIHGTLQVTGYNLAPATKTVNTANLVMMYFELNATGESMNITVFNVTRSGSAADADVLLVRLFNDTNNNAVFDSGTDTQLGAALNTSSSGMYKFTGFQYNVTTTANSAHRIIVVTNISSATAARTFSFGLNNTGDINVVGTVTAENLSIGSGNISFASAQSGTTTIHGTLTVVGKALGANATAINSTGFSVLLLNFTAVGEQINVTQINLTRTGTAADAPGDIFNVTLYNDTDSSGTFNSGDLAIVGAAGVNTTTAGAYLFRAISFNVTTTGRSVIVVVTTNETTTTGGATFNLSINSTGSVWAFTASSNVNLTGSSNITLTTTEGNVTRIFGTLAFAGTDLTPATVNDGQLNVPILNLTLTAAGEQMNLTQLNISLNNTNNDDVSAITLWNDTDRSGSINAGDYLIATATKTGSLAVFGTGTSQLLNVTAAADKRLIVAFNINSTATGGNLVDANLSTAANVPVTGSSSAVSITSSGLPINPVGESQITDLVATATIDFLNTKITASDNYNFTVENTGGEAINSIMIDYTASAFADPTAGNTICPTIAGGAWTKTLTADVNTINCTSPGGANNLDVGSKANVTVKNFQAPTSTGNKTFTVQVRGTSGGFANATTNGVTVSGLLNITGANQIATTVVVNSRNVSVIRYDFTASGEQMNITVIKLTRAGTSRESDIVNIKLFNDTDLDGTYSATTDTRQWGSTQTANTTDSQYVFTGFQFNVTTGANQSIFAVIEVGNTSTTLARTIILNINGTGDVNAIGSTTAVNVTENLTGTASTSSTIFGNLTVRGTSLVNSTVPIGTETAVMRLNFTSVGEGFNITLINVSVIGTATEANLTNVRLINDTNGNGIFDSGDATLGPQWNATSGVTFKLLNTTTQFNITTGGVNSVFIVVNTSTAGGTAGKTFNLSINGTGDIEAVGAVTATNVTEVLLTTTSSQTTVGGSFTITGKSLNTNSSINTGGISVLLLNLSATNEGMNITVIKITRGGNVAEGEIYNVTLYNDTDLSGTFNAGDTRIGNAQNTTTSSKYVFTGFQLNVTTPSVANYTLFVVVSTNSTAGKTFNLSLASETDIDSIGATSNANMTETLTTTLSTTESIFGTLTITGKALNGNTTVNTANFSVIQLNFSAAGEAMNISMVNISLTGSAIDTHVTNVRLINDTNGNGQFDASDTQIGPTVNQTTNAAFKFTLLNYFVPTTGTTLIVVVSTTSNSSAGGKTFNLSLTAAADVNTLSAVSAQNITETLTNTAVANITTILGTFAIAGNNLAASTVSMNSANVTVLGLNFTVIGEGVNITLVKITRKGTATDTDITEIRIINDTDLSGTFNSGDVQIGIATSNTTAHQYNFTGFQFNLSTTPTSWLIILNTSGTSGGKTYNLSINVTADINSITAVSATNITETLTSTESNTSTISGTLTITGKTLNTPTVNASTSGYSVLQLNFTSSGEAMNISVIKVTLKGSATSDHVNNMTLYNDTDLGGAFNAGDVAIGTVGVNTTTASQYLFTGLQFNITSGGTKTLFAIVTVNGSTTAGGKTFNLSINATSDVDTTGATSGVNVSETLTTTESNTSAINGTLSIRGLDLIETAPHGRTTDGFYAIPSNEANVPVMRLNFSAVGENMNITVIKIARSGPSAALNATDEHMVNLRLFNDTNGNGRFDSSSDTQIGPALNASAAAIYEFTGFQYNATASGLNTLFVVLNTTTIAPNTEWDPNVRFNLSLRADADVNSIAAVTAMNVTEAFVTTYINTAKITQQGWYNWTYVFSGSGWKNFKIPIQTIIEDSGRNASATGNFNFTSILSSLGSNWRYMYFNINGSSTGLLLADRTDPGGSTLRFVNNTNNLNADYVINMTASDRFEL